MIGFDSNEADDICSIYVPAGYVGNDPISGSATFFDLTRADIGAVEGLHVGSRGRNANELTMGEPGAAAPLPEGGWLLLSALGAGFAARRPRG